MVIVGIRGPLTPGGVVLQGGVVPMPRYARDPTFDRLESVSVSR
jgi:hypothetical protein